MNAQWWKNFTDADISKTPSIEDMNKIWEKMSPIVHSLVYDITDNAEYWQSIEIVINTLSATRDCPSPITDFSSFVNKLYEIQNKLLGTTPEDVISFIIASPKSSNAMFLIWQFADCLATPHIFVNALEMLFKNRSKVVAPCKTAMASFDGSLDFLFDHYYPMIESLPLDNEEQMTSRINLFQFLCKLIIDYPDKILRFNVFHRLMWNRLLRIMQNSNLTISIAAFRAATNLYKCTMEKLDGHTQATWLLKLITNNPPPSLLHTPSIRFAMTIQPPEFGFVTLCITIIDQGIVDQCDLGMISRILRLPVVKQPTDVFQYLFKTACTHKILGNAAARVLLRPLTKFKDLLDLKTWAPLFIKRSFQFIYFSDCKSKYIRRIFLIMRFYTTILPLEIDWINKSISLSASTVVACGRCCEMLGKRFKITRDVDPKMKEELEKTPIDKVDVKHMLDDVKTTILMIEEGGSADNSGQSSGRSSSARNRKPTVAEMRAKFRKGSGTPSTTDLDMLANMDGPPQKPVKQPVVDVDPSETY
ncbi:hypothetical protein TRFO_36954 [Tritrichomonas foetus]|uniref:Uncharacterized protein n=1 Tax=Tritrichomonas foetus TaxID=1144522 RepID=A0A1J4JC86_9EUKA|nr:hypothetical protein TRFO_36954 [Tritrichomonas foetus]|eukprot:OHS96798.1 hypothetical protein TRFO_36954 [Tritrichomonas foetus]